MDFLELERELAAFQFEHSNVATVGLQERAVERLFEWFLEDIPTIRRALRLAALVEDVHAFLRQETRYELSTGEKVANARAILARIAAAKAEGGE
jgi:hypothetical protein